MFIGTYKCPSEGPQNNSLLGECNFTFRFEDGYTYNCPLCSTRLERVSSGRSVSEVLAAGRQKEAQLR